MARDPNPKRGGRRGKSEKRKRGKKEKRIKRREKEKRITESEKKREEENKIRLLFSKNMRC